jgi:hypothetical protein
MPTHVVVDGSNIATEGGSTPSLQQLDEAVTAFMAEHPSDRVTVVVDASFGHRIDPSERQAYEEAIEANEIITPPAGTTGRGDAFILEIAERAKATVLSNDSFQEFHGEHTWLFDEGRLMGGKPVPDVGWVFLPRTPVRGPASRRSTRDAGRAARADAPAEPAPRSRGGRGRGRSSATPADEADQKAPAAKKSGGRSRSRGGARADSGDGPRPTRAEPLNEPLPFIEFVGANPVGSTVHGNVERFTSHGAHVLVGGVRCYVDLAGLGDPPPTRARDVLDRDETYDFLVIAVDTPRRGIDLARPGSVVAKEAGLTGAAKGRGRSRKAAAKPAADSPAKKSGGRTSKKAAAEPAKSGGGRSRTPRKKQQAEPAKTTAKKTTKKTSTAKRSRKAASGDGGGRRRGAASAPVTAADAPAPGDPNYGTISSPTPKKKGLLGRITGR